MTDTEMKYESRGTYEIAGKRILDLCLAFLLAIPALLICLICAVAIRYERNGSVLFKQIRIGRGQEKFTLFKLRTMAVETEHRPSHEISSAKVTRVGRFLRKTKLDELPQIINVIKGDMSFVGPRPCLPSQTELIMQREKEGAYRVRPGITGRGQVQGIDMSSPSELARIDGDYASTMSLGGDLRLMALTLIGRGGGDAVGGN
ncbi:sugar transferase [Limoniibacter endophyticus]|uniref:Lipid carrier--UDP-N-acetylgalactosaminyltransferase n=1 Tax=Limoniibacter endophyticus TaxID=1565040 RepID=A0A8J3DID0_9HYPH|nr:sugar transferase [Limoniibacter endophyticus]GHC70104.1 lipid carrier--UDP-N-acetylgalactosaminyltransferase [Limoniibacter endophyticus]